MDDMGNILIKRLSKGPVYAKNTVEESALSNDIIKLSNGDINNQYCFEDYDDDNHDGSDIEAIIDNSTTCGRSAGAGEAIQTVRHEEVSAECQPGAQETIPGQKV